VGRSLTGHGARCPRSPIKRAGRTSATKERFPPAEYILPFSCGHENGSTINCARFTFSDSVILLDTSIVIVYNGVITLGGVELTLFDVMRPADEINRNSMRGPDGKFGRCVLCGRPVSKPGGWLEHKMSDCSLSRLLPSRPGMCEKACPERVVIPP
jgi:ferredoxin